MYPKTYFDLFPAFPRENTVFVAMSFAPKFQSRYENVIKPAIEGLQHNGQQLRPHRVDAKKISDSILTEILSGIGNATYVFADITTMGEIDGRPYRNDNVMYEVGIATAMRLPEEVILFRSDKVGLLFDVANMRINDYSPDDEPEEAIKKIQEAMVEAGKEVKLKQHLAIKHAARLMDETCIHLLAHAGMEKLTPIRPRSIRDAMSAIHHNAAVQKLSDLGAVSSQFIQLTGNENWQEIEKEPGAIATFQMTEFGQALLIYIGDKMGMLNPVIRELLEKQWQQPDKKTTEISD